MDDADSVLLKDVAELPACVALLARGDRYVHGTGAGAHGIDIVEEDGFLHPGDVKWLQALGRPSGAPEVEPGPAVDGDLDAWTHGVPQRLDPGDSLVQSLHGDRLTTPERVDLHAAKALLDDCFAAGGDLVEFGLEGVTRLSVRGAQSSPAIGIQGDLIAHLATGQLIDRHAESFGLDIPQGQVDGTDRGNRHGTTGPGHTTMEGGPDVFELEGILSLQILAEVLQLSGQGGIFVLQ